MQNKPPLVAILSAALLAAAGSAQACAPTPAYECGGGITPPIWIETAVMRISSINVDPALSGVDGVRVQLESLDGRKTFAEAKGLVVCGEILGEPVCLLTPENSSKGN